MPLDKNDNISENINLRCSCDFEVSLSDSQYKLEQVSLDVPYYLSIRLYHGKLRLTIVLH